MVAHRSSTSRWWPAAVALLSTLALTGCGDDETVGGSAGPDQAVTQDLKIDSLQLEFPEDGQYEEGDDVSLYAALTNSGSTSYRLVDVQGPDFADARLTGRDGSAGAIEVPTNDNAYLEPDGPPSVVLQDLGTSLRSSQTIEVTFVFEDAGEVTMTAPVAADPPGQGDFQAPEDPTGDN